jgi:hypothetical protein
MVRGCLRRCGALIALFGLFHIPARAQGVVLFGNRNLPQPPERRVLLPNFAPLSGTNFLVQLLYEGGGTWIAHPGTSRFFDASATQLAGYWMGANRTLIGAGGPGVPVRLQVRVWDGGFAVPPLNFEEAQAQGRPYAVSPIFLYEEESDVFPNNTTDDKWMRNFMGGTWLLTPLYPQLRSVSHAGGEMRFLVSGNMGALVAVETKTDLNSSGWWIALSTNYAPFWFTNSTTDAERRFFRAVYR